MKTTFVRLAIAAMTSISLSASTYGECTQGGGSPHGGIGGGAYGSTVDDSYNVGQPTASDYSSAQQAAEATSSVVGPSAVPQARLTVVPSTTPNGSGQSNGATSVPSARLTVVADTSRDVAKPVADAVAEALAKIAPDAKEKDAATNARDEDAALSETLRSLVGTWKAVARYGDGELSTVELQLDDRGWAKFTIPGPDGKPSTVERRVELENDELKLTGPDSELALGKLIESNRRQMVLALADGRITFVRP